MAEDTNAVYFQRTTTGPVPLPSSIDEANEVMPNLFEFGSLNENATLLMLDQVLQNVYLPILAYSGGRSEQATNADSTTSVGETPRQDSMGEASKGRVVIRDEFLINLQKFANHIGRTMQQLAGDIRLKMPDLVLTDDISELARNPEIVASLEETLHDWEVTMASALEQQLNHTPSGKRNVSRNGLLARTQCYPKRFGRAIEKTFSRKSYRDPLANKFG